MSRRTTVGPFNRVEGDLEVHLDVDGGRVSRAFVNSPLYRGFEQILVGKDPRDALVYTPRLCGICSVSQSVAAASALARVQGLQMPANGALATNLVLAAENVADHLTHFYLFFMPDFAREVYAGEPWYPEVSARFRAIEGRAGGEVLAARAEFLHIMGILAGHWPHSLALQPGGTTRPVQRQERVHLLSLLGAFREFLEATLYGDELESVVSLDSAAALEAWRGAGGGGDLRTFLDLADALSLNTLGRATDRFMSYGAYAFGDERLFRRGTWAEAAGDLDPALITEDLHSAWMTGTDGPVHPFVGVTDPQPEREDAYSWCKAPRLDGQVLEVGALARQVVDGQPLIRELVAAGGGNVRNRVIARLLEIARVVMAMETWARDLAPGEPFCSHGRIPGEAEGAGMVEAARGSLGHWLRTRGGRIQNYQIIAPTTWNFSPRDRDGIPGALEQALVGAPVRDGEREPVAVQHVVRSFDPCMVCTVH